MTSFTYDFIHLYRSPTSTTYFVTSSVHLFRPPPPPPPPPSPSSALEVTPVCTRNQIRNQTHNRATWDEQQPRVANNNLGTRTTSGQQRACLGEGLPHAPSYPSCHIPTNPLSNSHTTCPRPPVLDHLSSITCPRPPTTRTLNTGRHGGTPV